MASRPTVLSMAQDWAAIALRNGMAAPPKVGSVEHDRLALDHFRLLQSQAEIDQAAKELEAASLAVAHAARDASAEATQARDGWVIPGNEMDDLRAALKRWTDATQAALGAIAKAGA